MKFRLHPLLLTNIFLGIFSLIVTSAVADNAKKPYWQDVQVVAVNKEYPRSSFMTYDNREDALSGKFERSKFYRLLNGTWKFYFVDSYKDLPDNITDPSVSTDSWYDIQVPGNWEVQGHGVAIYTNHGYEFKARNPQPPILPEATPVGFHHALPQAGGGTSPPHFPGHPGPLRHGEGTGTGAGPVRRLLQQPLHHRREGYVHACLGHCRGYGPGQERPEHPCTKSGTVRTGVRGLLAVRGGGGGRIPGTRTRLRLDALPVRYSLTGADGSVRQPSSQRRRRAAQSVPSPPCPRKERFFSSRKFSPGRWRSSPRS